MVRGFRKVIILASLMSAVVVGVAQFGGAGKDIIDIGKSVGDWFTGAAKVAETEKRGQDALPAYLAQVKIVSTELKSVEPTRRSIDAEKDAAKRARLEFNRQLNVLMLMNKKPELSNAAAMMFGGFEDQLRCREDGGECDTARWDLVFGKPLCRYEPTFRLWIADKQADVPSSYTRITRYFRENDCAKVLSAA